MLPSPLSARKPTCLFGRPEDQRPVLHKSTAQLRTYSGELMHVCGSITVCVSYRQQQKTLPLLVVRGAAMVDPCLDEIG